MDPHGGNQAVQEAPRPVPVHPAGVVVPGGRRGPLGVRHPPPGKALLAEVHAVHLEGPGERRLS